VESQVANDVGGLGVEDAEDAYIVGKEHQDATLYSPTIYNLLSAFVDGIHFIDASKLQKLLVIQLSSRCIDLLIDWYAKILPPIVMFPPRLYARCIYMTLMEGAIDGDDVGPFCQELNRP
jgi:hypothetical protein